MNLVFQEIESRVGAIPGVKAASFLPSPFERGVGTKPCWSLECREMRKLAFIRTLLATDILQRCRFPCSRAGLSTQATLPHHSTSRLCEHSAQKLFPPGNPIGHHFKLQDGGKEIDYEVIGVVKDVNFSDLREKTKYVNSLSYRQRPWTFGDCEVRYGGDYGTVSRAVQRTIRSVNRGLPIMNVTTLDEQVARSMTNQRLVAQLSTFFGLLAVFLSCIGIYGVMSYTTSRRTNEIGLRIALGADRASVRWMVMRETLLLVSCGIALGIPITLTGRRLIESMLYGVRGGEFVSLSLSAILLFGVAILAGFLPAHRASKIDPMIWIVSTRGLIRIISPEEFGNNDILSTISSNIYGASLAGRVGCLSFSHNQSQRELFSRCCREL